MTFREVADYFRVSEATVRLQLEYYAKLLRLRDELLAA
jgi:DeoR/GlpR family transcriptional regulator of sugar metabolism